MRRPCLGRRVLLALTVAPAAERSPDSGPVEFNAIELLAAIRNKVDSIDLRDQMGKKPRPARSTKTAARSPPNRSPMEKNESDRRDDRGSHCRKLRASAAFRLARNSIRSRSSVLVSLAPRRRAWPRGRACAPRSRPWGRRRAFPSAVMSRTSLASSPRKTPVCTLPSLVASTTDSNPWAICLLGLTIDSSR